MAKDKKNTVSEAILEMNSIKDSIKEESKNTLKFIEFIFFVVSSSNIFNFFKIYPNNKIRNIGKTILKDKIRFSTKVPPFLYVIL